MKLDIDYIASKLKNGFFEHEVSRWEDFNDVICNTMLDHNHYIWRGQRSADWLLESNLDRLIKKYKISNQDIGGHLNNFKFATRGRRGTNPVTIETDDGWWALGQHHGLATPLLDWTTSPYVAAYFAFKEESDINGGRRAIYALNHLAVTKKCNEIVNAKPDTGEQDSIKFIQPLSDENPRLVNQSGLFSKAPIGIDIETWVKEKFAEISNRIYLMKIVLPDQERDIVLKALNRMNINHLTLFPDLSGASEFCNTSLKIRKY